MRSIEKGYIGFTEGMIVGPSKEKYEGGYRQIDWDKLHERIEQNKDVLASVR